MTAAIFGLIGVLCGAFLTGAKEWWFQWRKDKRDTAYLAIQVVGLLDRYILGCAAIVGDDGLSEGQPNENGYRRLQTPVPKFEPESLKVEWRALPFDLMYEILDLPYKAEIAAHAVDGAREYAATPPDFEEFFEERQLQYAEIGLLASELGTRLRDHAGLPSRTVGDWDPNSYMREAKDRIVALRKERDCRWNEEVAPTLPRLPHDA